jgi:hypothetical protein
MRRDTNNGALHAPEELRAELRRLSVTQLI